MKQIILKKNSKKIIFTPGPASLIKDNISNLNPAFGRGDNSYKNTEKNVFSRIKKISGHKNIVVTQGAGSTVLEMVALNFLKGNVLIVSTGYYSDRLYNLALLSKKTHKFIKKISKVDWKNIHKIKKKYDWIWACYTETSCGLKLSMTDLRKLSRSSSSKLALDATSSFGLEKGHKYADVISFSSCKGLLGLTGAGFICYNEKPKNKVNSFVLNLNNALNKKMTGPYHSIQSLELVLKNYNYFKKSILINKKKTLKKFKDEIIFPKKNQPLLCTYLKKKVRAKSSKVILYQPRVKLPGSVICHLGEAHLGARAKGKILDYLIIDEKK